MYSSNITIASRQYIMKMMYISSTGEAKMFDPDLDTYYSIARANRGCRVGIVGDPPYDFGVVRFYTLTNA